MTEKKNEKAKDVEVTIPEVEITFGHDAIDKWKTKAWLRSHEGYMSILISKDFPLVDVEFMFPIIVDALKKEHKRRGLVIAKGELYVPIQFASHSAFSKLIRVRGVGDYIVFSKV